MSKSAKRNGGISSSSERITEALLGSTDTPKLIGDRWSGILNSEWVLWLLTAVSFMSYYILSFYHTSMYQGEEGAHYMNMKAFWHDPNSILGNWSKTGWKLVYAIPAYFGKTWVLLTNCLFASLSGYFAAKVVKIYNSKLSFLGVLLMFSQPLWVLLAFKNYSELLTAFLLIVSVYFAIREKFVFSALLLSFITLVRQEFYYLLPMFGLYLLWKRQFLAFLSLGLFPVLYSIWGWKATGDPLFLVNSAMSSSKEFKTMYPRQGFLHYPVMSEVVFGNICLVGFLLYVSQSFIQRVVKPSWFILIPILYFFFIHCIFNDTVLNLGPSTGGNLRYMLTISPLFSVLAVLGFEQFKSSKRKFLSLLLLIPFFLFVAANMKYEHNWIKFHPEDGDNFTLPILTLVSIVLLFLAGRKWLVPAIVVLVLINAFVLVKPKELADDENWAQREVVNWCKQQQLEKKYHMMSSMALFLYYYDLNPWEFPKGWDAVTPETIQKAPDSSIIIWDTHFALKYGKCPDTVVTAHPEKFKLLNNMVSPIRDIQILVFQKIGK